MSAPESITPSAGTPLRTSVPLATSSPSRTPISPASIPPRLSKKLSPSLDEAPPLSMPAKSFTPSVEVSSAMNDSTGDGSDAGSMLTSPDSLLNYAFKCGMQAIPALALGVIIDKILHKLQTRFDLGPLLMIVIQFIVIIVVLFIVEKYIAGKYAADWQISTPGIFFYVFFFGVQFNLFENLKKLKKIIFEEKQ